MFKSISSVQNPLVKHIVNLSEKAKVRRETEQFVVEGQREILLAFKGGFVPLTLIYDSSIISFEKIESIYGVTVNDVEMIEVTSAVYNKMAYRQGTEGLIGLFQTTLKSIDDLIFNTKTPLILVAEATEKPGNIGALMRTADAAGVDAFIIANPNTDLYNPNIIRSSVGCFFTNQVATGSTDEIIKFLKKNSISILCATISENSISCYECDYTSPTAIVVGTEATGLSDKWINEADKNIMIPMKGQIDSMNVSVSAAILLFEAVRQRHI